MIIQQIQVSETNALYILGFSSDTSEIMFRDISNVKQLQQEKITIIENVCYTTKYNFHKGYIDKFLKENE